MNLYLDYNATAPLKDAAKQAMQEVMNWTGNASSVHQFGRHVRYHIDQARQRVADAFETAPSNVVFTSGATEANHLALCGFKGSIIVSAVEHDSIDQARLDRQVCPVDKNGIVDLNALEMLLQEKTGPTLVSIMAANNETGVIQPLEEVIALTKRYGAYMHCDAVQAVGRIPFSSRGIDLISVSAHKLGGPSGIGALLVRTEMGLVPQLRGGGQERSLRSGTENIIGIVGFAAALKALENKDWSSVKEVRDALETQLQAQCADAFILAKEVTRLPNTTIVAMKGVKNSIQVMNFDLNGIAVSAGAACSSGKVKSSRVLAAMGVPSALADCAIRVSLGHENVPDLVHRFCKTWMAIYERAQIHG